MALTAGVSLVRRGAPRGGNEFGYYVAAGEKIFRGGLVGLNSSGNMQRLQTSGTVVFCGIADRDLDNSASGAVSTTAVIALKGTYGLTISGATASNINAAVYATADNVLTLSSAGSPLQIGTLAGIDNGQTFVAILGA